QRPFPRSDAARWAGRAAHRRKFADDRRSFAGPGAGARLSRGLSRGMAGALPCGPPEGEDTSLSTLTILAPASTNASGTIVTTLSNGRTGWIQVYAATNYNPGPITWSCTSPSGVSVAGINGANPYYLSQNLQFTSVPGGTTSLTLKANDAT